MKTLQIILVISLILLLNASKITAQSEVLKKFEYGFAYGISLNDAINHIDNHDFRKKLSPVLLSSFVIFNQSEKLSFVAEIEYIHKGPQLHVIDYLTLSTLARYKVFNRFPNISVLGGLYGGYLFDYKINGDSIGQPNTLKSYDFGIDIGMDFTRKINDKLDFYLSPLFELGLIRFSLSQHLSYQLKAGVKF